MAKTWADVAASSAFQSLSVAEQEEARRQYFEEVVAPRVPEEDLNLARSQFDQETRIEKRPEPSLLDRVIDTAKEVGNAVLGRDPNPTIREGRSVMENYQPTPQEKQADVERRLSLGAGPISQQTAAKADLVRSGMAKADSPLVQKVANSMQEQNTPSIGEMLSRAKELQDREANAISAERQAFAEENPLLGALGSGAATSVAGAINIPTVAADFLNQSAVNPVLRALDLPELPRVPTMIGTEYLTKTAKDFMPSIGNKSMTGAWNRDEFGQWLGVKLAANSTQVAQSLAAAFAPPLRAALLPAMSGTAAGQSYVEGDDSRVAVAKGAIEYATEKLPLEAFDKIGDLMKAMGPTKSSTVLAVAGQRLLQSGGVITANALTNAIEESAAQLGGNALDKYFQGKDVELTKGLGEAAVVGAATGKMMSAPQVAATAAGAYDPNAQIARAMDQEIADTEFAVPAREVAADLLNPNSYDQRLISPTETARPAVQTQEPTAPADAQRARLLELDTIARGGTSYTYPTVGGQSLTVDIPEGRKLTEQETEELGNLRMARTEPINFTEPDSATAKAGLTPVVVPVRKAEEPAATAVELPPINPLTEQQFGLDKLRMGARNVSTGGNTGAAPAVGGIAGGNQRGGGVDLAGSGVTGATQLLSTGTAGAAANAGQDVVAGDRAGQRPASLTAQNNNAVVEPTQQWFGRKGDGYVTEQDAQQALPGRQRMFKDLDWKVEEMPNGKYRLAGYPQETTLGSQTTQAIQAETQGQEAPTVAGIAATATPAAPAPKLQDSGVQGLKFAPTASIKDFSEFQRAVASDGIEIAPVRMSEMNDQHKVASLVARMLGKTYTVARVTSGDPMALSNGMINKLGGKNIVAAENTEDAPLFVAIHEAYHGLPEADRKALNVQLLDLFKTENKEKFLKDFNYDETHFEEEAPAFMAQVISKRQDFWEELRTKMGNGEFAGVAKIILGSLNQILRKVSGAYGEDFADTYIKDIVKARNLLTDAYAKSMKDQGLTPDTNVTGVVSSNRVAPTTPEFKSWFGKSKMVDETGAPKVMYHGTDADISAFEPRDGMIFVTPDPKFAREYTSTTIDTLEKNGSQPNIIPVYVKAEKPFDYENPEHIAALQQYEKDNRYTERSISNYVNDIKRGDWEAIESRKVQAAIKAMGHDGFYVRESGTKNLGVFEPTQIKSATGNNGQYDPTNPDIRKSNRTEIGAKLQERIDTDFEGAQQEYASLKGTKGGRLLDTDIARELSPEYRQDRNRSAEVHEAASDFIQRSFEQRMAQPGTGDIVAFMAGGGGAGKSSAEKLLAPVLDRASTVLDGTLSTYDKARRNVQLALDSGRQVRIAYVYREPEEALRNGVLTRAMRGGRTVPVDALVKGHAGSSTVVRKLQAEFGDNPKFKIFAVDNSRGPGGADIVPLESITSVKIDGLKERFINATEDEYRAGRISEGVYRATVGSQADTGAGAQGQAGGGQVRQGSASPVQEGRGPEGSGNAVTQDEAVVDGVRYSSRYRDLIPFPTVEIRDLLEKKVVGLKADMTDAGRSYTGIDGSQLEFPIEMMGGTGYPGLPYNVATNVVWAVRGGATLTKILEQVKKSDYVLVHAMNGNSHLTNSTVSAAYLRTVEAYLRDGRISTANLKALDEIVRSPKNKSGLPDFPGFESPEIYSFIDGLSFDQRGALASILEKKEAQAHGLPNLERFRRETIDPDFAGYRQGDAMLVIEIDKKNPTVKLGEEGTKLHPSYPLGLRGKVIGKLAKGVNYETIFRDYFKFAVPNFKNGEAGAWYAFDRKMPIQKITQEIVNSVAPGGFNSITSARHARSALEMANNNWLVSGKTKAQGGISVQEFVDALAANDGAAALTLYTAEEVKAGIKDKSFTIYQLGKEGGDKGLQVFFGLKRGAPWYKDMIDGVTDNEVEVVSVTNNELGAPGIGIPAIITKAISEGATVLDAFAVKSDRFPSGFLPEMYGQFGFEEIGRIPFDPSYYNDLKMSDLKAFWSKGGWKEADGYPDVVVMRWKGKDEDRATAVERYVRSGDTGVSAEVPRYTRAAAGESDQRGNPPRGRKGGARSADAATAGGNQGAGDAASVVARAFGSIQELATLGDGDIRNLGLDPAEVQRLRDGLAGVRRSNRSAELARGPGQRSDEAARAGAVTGIHYGKVANLSVLSGRSFGSGIKGAEQARLAEPDVDPRIKKRVYFYLTNNNADMPRPEIGLGAHVYRATLGRMFDMARATQAEKERLQSLRKGPGENAFESAVLDAGYRGYVNRELQTAVVLNADVPVAYEGMADGSKMRDRVAERTVQAVATRTEGGELVRKPSNDEMISIIKARPALAKVAPSFKLQYGEARVAKDEADAADRVLADAGSSFQFGGVMRSNRVTDTPAFKRWTRGLDVIDAELAGTYEGGPAVFGAYHGTTHTDITEFKNIGNKEGALGQGPYLSTSVADVNENYAGVGPDLINRIGREEDSVRDSFYDDPWFATQVLEDYFAAEGIDTEVTDDNFDELKDEHGDKAITHAATSRLKGDSDGLVMPVYVRLEKPFNMAANPTMFEFTNPLDENGEPDYDAEPEGSAMDLIEAINTVADQYNADASSLTGWVYENALDGISAREVFDRAAKDMSELYDDNGELISSGQFVQDVAREMGFDGLIQDADLYFGTQRRGFGGIRAGAMKGVNPGTLHIMPFNATQVKSATGNNGEFDASNPDIRKSNRARESWFLGRDETGRITLGAGAKAYRVAADLANNVLARVAMKPIDKDLSRAMRKMKMEIEQARLLTADAADSLSKLSEDDRAMISDVIEGELKRGVKPPQRVLEVAASMQGIMSEQTAELVRLGMLSADAASRWDGKYLPRFYESKLMDEGKRWVKAAKSLLGKPRTMQGIKGSSLKGRGLFQTVPVEELEQWLAEGWEERDPNFDPDTDTEITIWRDYNREERENMGEIRDAMFRFVMGYTKSQQDIALGRLYEQLAATVASRHEQEGYVQVPKSNVEDTKARRYGKLAGMWVPQEVMDHLSATDNSMQSDVMKFYTKALSMWKEGKTVLNPVSHANNVISNLTAAHFAGVSYWDVHKYAGATRDLVKNSAMVQEARDAGLFGGTMTQAELVDMLPDQLKVLAAKTESKAAQGVETLWNAMSFWLRKPLGKAYEAEDLFFRYLIYRDARNQGLSPDDAVDYAQKYIFTYDDLPKGARMVRNFALPFFSYTYKVVPMLAQTALETPWRYAAPAMAIYTANAIAYAFAAGAGDDDDDWMSIIKRYVTDPEFRAKARGMEEEERKNLPSWMKGASLTLGTSKAVRLGVDEATDLPVFLDVSRMFPGGDLFDAQNNAGGIPLLAPITPNNPLLTAASALLFNKDSFTGKEVVKKTDTSSEAAAKRAEWAYKQVAPAIAVGNYHFDRAMNVIANVTGEPVNLGFKEYTGVNRDGTPVQPKYAAMQTVGIKARPIDLELSAKIDQSQTNAMVRDIDAQIRSLRRLSNKGAISDAAMEKETEMLKEKRQRLKEGLTIDGEEK